MVVNSQLIIVSDYVLTMAVTMAGRLADVISSTLAESIGHQIACGYLQLCCM